jgi:hypothetical protein
MGWPDRTHGHLDIQQVAFKHPLHLSDYFNDAPYRQHYREQQQVIAGLIDYRSVKNCFRLLDTRIMTMMGNLTNTAMEEAYDRYLTKTLLAFRDAHVRKY